MTAKSIVRKSALFGFVGSVILFLLYFLILSLLNSPSHALSQFITLWYLMFPLMLGFGIQIALFVYVKESFKAVSSAGATTAVAASGGISTVSMAACCAHHLTDVLPLLGLAFLSTALAKYQTAFILLGVLSNLIGITMMLSIIQKNALHASWKGIFKSLMKINMQKAWKLAIVFSIIIFGLSLYLSFIGG